MEEKDKKKKKKKVKFVDDGRTVYSMENLEAFGHPKQKSAKENLSLTGKERRALIKAAFSQYGPMLLGVLACFSVAMVLIYLWLR